MKFLDLFAGIGGFRLGMEAAGHECAGYVEWDKFARKSYEAIHNTKGEWTAHDITTVTNNDLRLLRGTVDVICGGFPCQAFSIAGKRLGFAETRGTLFFEIARFAKEIQPQYLFLENVKGLLNHDGGNTFRTIISTLDELGYDAEWQVLNSKDYGVPQNRERVFIIGHLRGRSRREVFPIRRSCKEASVRKIGMLDVKGKDQIRRVYGTDGIAPCLTTMQGGGQEPKIVTCVNPRQTDGTQTRQQDRVYIPDGNMVALSAQLGGRYNIVQPENIESKPPYRIRRLTPRECWRLQGFPDWAFDRAREVNSDSQLYKQAGNSVTVPVIYEIAKRLV
ncbi:MULTISPECIES: DNA cytosine methyltransferase [Bacillus cereus group]|uniref:DNA cytosine methyltransferase n=1 Tax=Bacillus cereus group TaxID=86661 RepID=UPI0022E70EBD|nr:MULTISPECIES: DNA cytosine methyltransferase [Bacillus cereus group]MDX5882306.1 DNA cytosine methyltransferase [Bacillus cereus group sp. BfR-BA-00999]